MITIHTKGLFTENDEQNKTKTIRAFSDTRWTVRCSALVRIIQHYDELKELWKWCLKEYQDTETKARIIGVQTQMNKFNHFFEVKLAILLLRHSDNLGTTLQNPKLSASQAQSIARKTVITLEKLRDDDYFLLFWKEVLTESRQLDIDEPALGRKRKASRRIEDDYSHSSIGFFHEKFEDFARQIYFEVLDLLINAIKNRFEHKNYKRYIILENLLLKCAKNESYAYELETVFNNYSEFQREQLLNNFPLHVVKSKKRTFHHYLM